MLGYMRPEADAMRRWFARAASKDSILGSLRTLAWVVPLTGLIWSYAEREQLYTDPGVVIAIDVVSGDPAHVVVKVLRPSEKMMMADLRGPRSRVESVKAQFARAGGPSALTIVADPKLTPGQPHDLPAAAFIANNPVFVQNNVQVTNFQPAILTIFVDTLAEEELPVEAPTTLTNLVGKPIFEPAKVRVRAPTSALARAKAQGLVAIADIANLDQLKTPGQQEIPAARVIVPGVEGENVTITPSTVKATVDVRQSDIDYKIPSMPITASGPVFLLKQYRVECKEENISNVTVKGPKNMIEMIRNETVKPRAVLDITLDDRPTGGANDKHTRKLRFEGLPENVRVAPEDAQREVQFSLVERGSDQ
jgi:hypothetical protein